LSDYQVLSGMVRRELPETTLIFLAIKPSPVRWSIIDRIREANRLIQAFCEADARLKYVDVTHPMLDSQGWPRRELFERDGLHLSEEGYRLWTRLVEPFLPRDANRNRPGQPF
ncbi:MAG: GDSL-type esterase/lipase family protein, partial [Gemmataceae bacterium]